MPITSDLKKYGDEARKPLFAAVGAAELAYGQIVGQLTDLPVEAQARLKKLSGET
jgi:hypothetical protein